MRRLLTAALFVPGLLAIVLLAPAWAFAVLAAVGVAMALLEFAGLLGRAGLGVQRLIAMGICVPLCLLFAHPAFSDRWILWAVLLTCGLAVLSLLVRGARPLEALTSTAATLLAVVYPGILLSFLVGLRAAEGETGRQLLLFFLAVIWFSDSAAFYVGSAIGRHKLAPQISPAKTVEGAVAAVVTGALVAPAWRTLFMPEMGAAAPLLGAGLAVAGIGGDLAESVMKRAARMKDTAAVLPGHGGVLDRVDSLLLAAPLFYYLYPLFLS